MQSRLAFAQRLSSLPLQCLSCLLELDHPRQWPMCRDCRCHPRSGHTPLRFLFLILGCARLAQYLRSCGLGYVRIQLTYHLGSCVSARGSLHHRQRVHQMLLNEGPRRWCMWGMYHDKPNGILHSPRIAFLKMCLQCTAVLLECGALHDVSGIQCAVINMQAAPVQLR